MGDDRWVGEKKKLTENHHKKICCHIELHDILEKNHLESIFSYLTSDFEY